MPTTDEVLAHLMGQLDQAISEADDDGEYARSNGLRAAYALVGRVQAALEQGKPLPAPYDQPATVPGPDGRPVWNDARFSEEV